MSKITDAEDIAERGVNAIARLARMRGSLDDTQTIVSWMHEARNELRALRSKSEAVGVKAWTSDTVAHLQRAIMDDDEEVRERAAAEIPDLYSEAVAPYVAALSMVREAVGELFGPAASIESPDAVLLRGPEPHHDAEAVIAALQRVSALTHPAPATVVSAGERTVPVGFISFYADGEPALIADETGLLSLKASGTGPHEITARIKP